MLDREQAFAGVEIDDVLEAVLVLVALLGDQPAFFELGVRAQNSWA